MILETITAVGKAVGAISETAKLVMQRVWGGQTKTQAELEKKGEDHGQTLDGALAQNDLNRANAAKSELDALHDESAAKSGG